MFRSRKFYVFDKEEKTRLAARSDEISSESLYDINAFVTSFLEYLDDFAKEEKKAEEEKEPEISEEEQQRLAVIEIQKLLNAAGCNASVADGIWGRRTQAAAVLFAKTAKLPFSNVALLSDQFLHKLKTAPSNFCPKPRKKTPTATELVSSQYGSLRGPWKMTINCVSAPDSIRGTHQIRLIGREGRPNYYGIQLNNRSGAGQLRLNSDRTVSLVLGSYSYVIDLISNKVMRGHSKGCNINIRRS